MSDSLKTLLIVGVLILILWNLGAGLHYIIVARADKRTVNSLTRRIGLSVALILFVVLAIYMGWITRTASAPTRTDFGRQPGESRDTA